MNSSVTFRLARLRILTPESEKGGLHCGKTDRAFRSIVFKKLPKTKQYMGWPLGRNIHACTSKHDIVSFVGSPVWCQLEYFHLSVRRTSHYSAQIAR